jgi:phosphatidylglycerol:prolipoprotein diacylglycerol transferase
MIGVLTACWWISRGVKNEKGERVGALPMLHIMDLTALACTPGLFFGRLANFINGELLGDIVAAPGQPAPWWAVKFPQEHFSGHAPVLSPQQQVDLVRLLESYYPGTEPDSAYDRLLHLIQSPTPEAAVAAAKLAPFIAARHPSQIYQAAAEGLVLGTTLLLLWATPRRPGFIVAMFLIMYGVLRILTELYRLPDADLGRVMGLSRGQWLSVLMIGMGLIPMYLSTRRKDVYGGWWKRAG